MAYGFNNDKSKATFRDRTGATALNIGAGVDLLVEVDILGEQNGSIIGIRALYYTDHRNYKDITILGFYVNGTKVGVYVRNSGSVAVNRGTIVVNAMCTT